MSQFTLPALGRFVLCMSLIAFTATACKLKLSPKGPKMAVANSPEEVRQYLQAVIPKESEWNMVKEYAEVEGIVVTDNNVSRARIGRYEGATGLFKRDWLITFQLDETNRLVDIQVKHWPTQ